MKKLILVIVMLIFGLSAVQTFAYNVVDIHDSVSTGGTANIVWYSLKNGVVQNAPAKSWDLAFQTSPYDAGIFINEYRGIRLWNILGTTDADLDNAVDTNGLAEDANGEKFVEWHNSTTTWSTGAFNMGMDGINNGGNYGCLLYNINTHVPAGSTAFVIKLPNGEYKKIYAESIQNGIITMVYSDLDGTNQTNIEVSKTNFQNKLFAYFSFDSASAYSIEPDKQDWDLQFGAYYGLVPDPNGNLVYYSVNGVRTNAGIHTAVVESDNPGAEMPPAFSLDTYSSSITAIGSDWKSYNMTTSQYDIDSKRTFFITKADTDLPGDIMYRLYFTSYRGGGEGEFVFAPKKAAVLEDAAGDAKVGRNVLSAGEPVNIDMRGENASGTLSVYMPNGQTVYSSYVNGTHFEIPTNGLSTGMYFINLNVNGKLITGKFIIE